MDPIETEKPADQSLAAVKVRAFVKLGKEYVWGVFLLTMAAVAIAMAIKVGNFVYNLIP